MAVTSMPLKSSIAVVCPNANFFFTRVPFHPSSALTVLNEVGERQICPSVGKVLDRGRGEHDQT